jgi:signal transduction histidine kinase
VPTLIKTIPERIAQWILRFSFVEKLLSEFGISKARYPDSRQHLQAGLILLFVFVYIIAWLAHIPIYIALGNTKAALLVAVLGLSSALLALVFVRFRKNTLAALSANLGGLAVLLAITVVTGGMNSPILAWLFFGTMTTFLLMGARAGWLMTGGMLLGTLVITLFQQNSLLPASGFPFGVESEKFIFFSFFVYAVSIVSLSAVTTIYEYLQFRAFSELRVAMNEVHEQHNSILSMLNNINQGVLTILPNGTSHQQYSAFLRKILGHNNIAGERFEKIIFEGMQCEKVRKQKAVNFLLAAFGRTVESFLAERDSTMPQEVVFRDAQGLEKVLEFDWIPMSDDGFSITKIMVSIRDVTHVRKLEKEAKIVEQQRVSQAKMAALGEMAGGVAHEINNPLAVIEMNASLIEGANFDLPSERAEVTAELSAIRKQVERIGRIVRSLLSFARQSEADAMRPISVDHVIDDVVELINERTRKSGVRLVIEKRVEAPPHVLGDHSKIMQVLLNFLNNAFYSLETSDVLQRRVEIRVEDAGQDMVEISVHDNGPGIPAELQEKIMVPFFTTKPVGVGTGIGLSLSRSLAQEMKGSIHFVSEPGHTFFAITLKKNAAL